MATRNPGSARLVEVGDFIPIIYMFFCIPGGAGFLLSIVSMAVLAGFPSISPTLHPRKTEIFHIFQDEKGPLEKERTTKYYKPPIFGK